MFRFIAFFVALLALLYLPWWLWLFGVSILFFLFESYYEGIILALVADFMYSVNTGVFFGFQFIYALIALILFVLIEKAKTRLSFYRNV
jgi:hypothetical protein